ncbi:3-deoxy-D-manno-octulosonic-acid transferase [Mizugakiibacter sediminis]|uniref:3-deoxy-D-manno-octulosonic acid transferase n=1 Tax=Mizugakiibacter sediminis TaxID=1475481 RepID=A0A0K8QR35_9GAMM|nr:lipid IV(A) 3-deoxy-D-manno-octulosonic acid transferase [Mizugakiibacter sediminis]GAP67345.1 3-deoxy-D-manno-octulosonic-acid transferase [Mizugakiibacter sediminis]
MRLLYTLLMYLAMPVIVYRLVARGFRYHGYFARWRERFGFLPGPPLAGSIWVHAVSVGEVNAAVPLIEALLKYHADARMVVTTVTPTGSERVQKLFGDRVYHVYLPYDLPRAVRRFLDHVRPRLAVIMETEIWPNLYHASAARGLPLVIANARLSARSLRRYAPVRGLVRDALACVSQIAAQSHADAARFRALGAPDECITVVGNLKFDMTVPAVAPREGAELRAAWGASRPVWIAASTHEAEETAVLEAHLEVLRRLPDALLLLAPRHPERFRAVDAAARNLGFRVATHSADHVPAADTQCFVIDAMGVLLRHYAAADVAFVAGSLVPIGGHNVLEAAALGRPVVVGPYTFNFEEITASLIEAGGALRTPDAARLGATVLELLRDPSRAAAMGAAARAVFERERGAVSRTMALIQRLLTGAAPSTAAKKKAG